MIYSKNEENHVEHLATVLRLLREHQLYAKLNKCSFCQTKAHYLGHVVSKEGIKMDPKNIRFFMEWEAPRNVDKVRSFMGLSGYCRRFIRNFSHIAYHITSLQNKGNKFEWTQEFAIRFEKLKQLLTIYPMLKIADPDKEFVVCKYSYKRGLGGFLMQEGQVVCYESHKLNEHKKKYLTRDLELAVIIHTLKM